jgi:hypothetical protein
MIDTGPFNLMAERERLSVSLAWMSCKLHDVSFLDYICKVSTLTMILLLIGPTHCRRRDKDIITHVPVYFLMGGVQCILENFWVYVHWHLYTAPCILKPQGQLQKTCYMCRQVVSANAAQVRGKAGPRRLLHIWFGLTLWDVCHIILRDIFSRSTGRASSRE